MRSTITLDPDVAALLKDAQHQQRRSFKEVVNDAIRSGLLPRPAPPNVPPYVVAPHAGGLRPEFRLVSPNQLASEFEDEELAQKLRAP